MWMSRAFGLAVLLVALCLPVAGAEGVPDGDLLAALENAEVAQQKGSEEKLRVMEQMAQNQKHMMTQMSDLGGMVKKVGDEGKDTRQTDLQHCRRELHNVRTRLRGTGGEGVADLHSLLAPRGSARLFPPHTPSPVFTQRR